MKKCTLILFALLTATPFVAAQNVPNDQRDAVIDFYLTLKNKAANMPGLSREGVTLSKPYLLDKLKQSIDKEGVQINDLLLTPEKGTVILTTTSGISTRHTLDFRFLPVEWATRTVKIAYQENSEAASDSLIARVLGNLAIGAFSFATGNDAVRELTDKLPYASTANHVLSIKLDQVPSLAPTLNTQFFGYKPFDYIGIKELKTAQDQIVIKLGRVDNARE